MPVSPKTAEGWYCLHDVRSFAWPAWKALAEDERKEATAELVAWLEEMEAIQAKDRDGDVPPADRRGASALYALTGGKGDLLWVHFRPTVEDLNAVERAFARTRAADLTWQTFGYLSVAELSGYQAEQHLDPDAEVSDELRAWMDRRLHPEIPDADDKPYVSFYPMSKRRAGEDNWYMLPKDERAELMKAHGQTGRKYTDRVTQVIGGSTGLDDWEWGVTIFGVDPVDLKHLVYEMRFDEASARYADFGPFYLGTRLRPGDVEAFLAGEHVGRRAEG